MSEAPPAHGNTPSVTVQAAIGAVAGAAVYIPLYFLNQRILASNGGETPDFPLGLICKFTDTMWISFFTFAFFGAAVALLVFRYRDSARQRRGFATVPLEVDEETLVLPEDALVLRRRMQKLAPADRELVVNRLVDAALQRARANWSAEDVAAAVESAAGLVEGSRESEYALIRYLAWAIPSVGFIGTVLGIGDAMYRMHEASKAKLDMVAAATPSLATAFDTTFVALLFSLIIMFFMHSVQGREDEILTRAKEVCLKRFVFRMHIRPSEAGGGGHGKA